MACSKLKSAPVARSRRAPPPSARRRRRRPSRRGSRADRDAESLPPHTAAPPRFPPRRPRRTSGSARPRTLRSSRAPRPRRRPCRASCPRCRRRSSPPTRPAACPVSRRSSQRSGRAPHPAARRGPPAAAGDAAVARQPTVVVLSWDGVRHDYPDRTTLPNLARIARDGARAERLVPPFPSSTFPSHVTLATGARVDRHGIVANAFRDRTRGPFVYLNDAKLDPRRAAVVRRRAAGRAQRGLLLGRLRDPVERRRGDLPQGALGPRRTGGHVPRRRLGARRGSHGGRAPRRPTAEGRRRAGHPRFRPTPPLASCPGSEVTWPWLDGAPSLAAATSTAPCRGS